MLEFIDGIEVSFTGGYAVVVIMMILYFAVGGFFVLFRAIRERIELRKANIGISIKLICSSKSIDKNA